VVNAGPDATAGVGAVIALQGSILYTNAAPLIVQWKLYSGPTNVLFSDASRTNSTATFPSPGTYTLTLSADDATHTVAYDAVVVQVATTLTARIQRSGSSVLLTWNSQQGPYEVQKTDSLNPATWVPVTTTSATNLTLPRDSGCLFYRVKGQ